MSQNNGKIEVSQVIKVKGLVEYGRTVEFNIHSNATPYQLAQSLKTLLLASTMNLDYEAIVDEILKLERGEPSLFQEKYTGFRTIQ